MFGWLQQVSRTYITRWILWLIRLNLLSWRIHIEYAPNSIHKHRPAIYVFWHKHYLAIARCFARQNAIALCSPSRDGAANAALLQKLGYKIIWGSSHKRGARALKQLVEVCQTELSSQTSPGIFLACDGSRGPAQKMKPGALYLAQKTGLPLFLLSAKVDGCIRLNTWDRTWLPLPFARIRLVISAPYFIPPDTNRTDITQLAKVYSKKLDALC